MAKSDIIERKKEHLKIALSPFSQTGDTGFSRYRFLHNALPEIDYDKIDTSVKFLGKKVSYPFFISCMTGGMEKGALINRNLAKAAEKKGIALGVGSQRAAVERPKLQRLFEVRKYAPNVPVMANVGLVQLNYGFGLKEINTIINMVSADVLVFHLNPVQELIQPEGDRNFSGLEKKLENIIDKIKVPVIVKEVGFGLSEDSVRRLYNAGVRIFDTAGLGGTNWAYIEGRRREGYQSLGELFSDWGISTTDSILAAKKVKDEKKNKEMIILGSGGVRSGIDIAKCIALGADLAGIALPFARAALISSKAVEELIEQLATQLKISMMGVGVNNISKLKRSPLVAINNC